MKWLRSSLLLAATLTMVSDAHAQSKSSFSGILDDPFLLMMIIVMIILLLIIALLANVVIGAATYYYEQQKKETSEAASPQSPTLKSAIVTAVLICFGFSSVAQQLSDESSYKVAAASSGSTAFYFIVGVLVVELVVVFVLLFLLRTFLRKTKRASAESKIIESRISFTRIWDKLNSFRPISQESQLELDHDYDGIRELDNRLPPWWLYGFYLTIVFAGIYLWRYHVSHSAPLSSEEFQIAMADAEMQKQDYLKRAANLVDENTVKLITDANELEGGKKIFDLNCSACHGKAGEGSVGPNLTDDYWLHGGKVQDVFKSIKYGWPEKGMKSWQEDFSPLQIAQLASYIKSLKGSNPPNAKERQGDLFEESAADEKSTTDSAATAKTGSK